jgi:hypothetical protein
MIENITALEAFLGRRQYIHYPYPYDACAKSGKYHCFQVKVGYFAFAHICPFGSELYS